MASPERTAPDASEQDWRQVLTDGSDAAFRDLVTPHTDALRAAARKALAFYHRQGYLRTGDLTPEEVAGEALLAARAHGSRRPPKMGLRAWLLATQYRVLRGLVERQRAYRDDKAVSLDAPLPTDPSHRAGDSVQEWFYEWYQPDAVITWEDVTPSRRPVDYEIPLTEDVAEALADREDAYHALIMHDEFEMDLPEVAFAMGQSLDATAELLDQARASFRQHVGQSSGIAETDHPAE